jgi:hypothetical protein
MFEGHHSPTVGEPIKLKRVRWELAAADGRRPQARTVWQQDTGEVAPRLITAYRLDSLIWIIFSDELSARWKQRVLPVCATEHADGQ